MPGSERAARRFIRAFLRLAVVVGVTGPAVAGPFEDGLAAYNNLDMLTAAQLWLPLAEHGDGRAQYEMGMMCSDGTGVPQDYLQAHIWFNLAASVLPFGPPDTPGPWREDAARARDRIAGKLTSAQIAEAQRLATAWRPK